MFMWKSTHEALMENQRHRLYAEMNARGQVILTQMEHRQAILKEEIHSLKAQLESAQAEAREWRGRAQLKALIPPTQEISQDDIRKLIRLCHPDKHGSSNVSNEMTAKLLKLRK